MLPLLTLLLAIHIAPDGGQLDYRQPQLAASAELVAVTFGAGNAIYFSTSHDRGATFSKPIKVAESPKLSLGRHRGPRAAITPAAIVISAVSGAEGNLTAWRSTDGGKTWSAGVAINDQPTSAREGLHSMVSGGGVLFATWLDDRANGKRLYSATSKDNGATWSKNVEVYQSPSGTICQCCHPSAVIDAKGVIHVMWRNALDGNRDMYVADSTNGGASFGAARKMGEGSWALNACPMDGGGLSLDSQRKLVSIWRRGEDIYVAEDGRAEKKMEAGKDAAIANGPGGVYAVWTSAGAVRAQAPGNPQPRTLAARGGFPQVIAVPGGKALAAWEDNGRIFIQPID